MLSALDLVIAFAVIMTVLSLFITILVQMVSTALALRGKNLANAVALTFQTIDPHIGEHAHSLAAQILRDPIFCDSIWRPKTRKKTPEPNKATLALVEAEQALKKAELDLAKNVDSSQREGLENAVANAAAQVAAAKKQRGVMVPTVAPNKKGPWGFWTWPRKGARQLCNAIRPGEIYRILHELAELTETQAALRDIPPELARTAAILIQKLGKTDRPAMESRGKLVVLRKVSELFTNPAEQQAVIDSLPNLSATVERATTQAYDRFQRWFGSGQDRAEQWFRTHVRAVTIVMSISMALVLQLDTVDIYRQLRSQPKLVEALVKSAPSVLEEGGTVLDPTNTEAYHAYLLWLEKHPLFSLKALPTSGGEDAYRQALAERLKEGPSADYLLQQFDRAFESASNAEGISNDTQAAPAQAAYAVWIKKFPAFKLDPEPDFAAATRTSVRAALEEKVAVQAEAAKLYDKGIAALLGEYDSLQTAGKLAFQRARQATFRDLEKQLSETGFDLVPSRLFRRWDDEKLPPWASGLWPFVGHYLVHLLGSR